ncbi:DNA-binding protein [Moraxella osloensis]|nr:DNA-binding protein [Moraxella osloensis]MDI4481595.1 DNA-binding protein [Moraxella osloensis]
MARTGLYKSEVKKARESLLAQSKYPSVDAVRVELGNTGSKTTIHKYLKELEEEDGGATRHKVDISEALQNLISRLSSQLQDEANVQVNEIRAESTVKDQQHAEQLLALHTEIEALGNRVRLSESTLLQEKSSHHETHIALQKEMIARHTLTQQVADLNDRLAENEAHRQSLEEKHQHARDALEHYRQSVKEQREQDQRRHELQIQQLQAELRQVQQTVIIKQDESTKLNQESTRLAADLSHAQRGLSDELHKNQRLAQQLQANEQHSKVLEVQLVDREIMIANQNDQLVEATNQMESFSAKVHGLQLELATANAKLEAQDSILGELRDFMSKTNFKALVE